MQMGLMFQANWLIRMYLLNVNDTQKLHFQKSIILIKVKVNWYLIFNITILISESILRRLLLRYFSCSDRRRGLLAESVQSLIATTKVKSPYLASSIDTSAPTDSARWGQLLQSQIKREIKDFPLSPTLLIVLQYLFIWWTLHLAY